MPDSSDIQESIAQNAADGIASVSAGGQTVVAKDIDQQIKADQYLDGKQATASDRPGLGIRFQKFRPVYS